MSYDKQAPAYNTQYNTGYTYPQVSTGVPHTTNTTVVVQQPMGGPMGPPKDWSTGVFDCCDDMGICCCGTFCAFCLNCQVASDMNESMCLPCCVPANLTALRTKWRTQHNIEGSIMKDCLLESFCGYCALCQLARDVKLHRQGNAYATYTQ